jgi:hypothetical protein
MSEAPRPTDSALPNRDIQAHVVTAQWVTSCVKARASLDERNFIPKLPTASSFFALAATEPPTASPATAASAAATAPSAPAPAAPASAAVPPRPASAASFAFNAAAAVKGKAH